MVGLGSLNHGDCHDLVWIQDRQGTRPSSVRDFVFELRLYAAYINMCIFNFYKTGMVSRIW